MNIQKHLQEILCRNFFLQNNQKSYVAFLKELDANWAPKRVQITEERRAFYQDQWSAVGNEGSGTILGCLEKKVLDLYGVINLKK